MGKYCNDLNFRENVNISSQLAQLTEKATNLTAENDKLAVSLILVKSHNNLIMLIIFQVREMTNKTKVSLLEAEIEKLSRRNAYRSDLSSVNVPSHQNSDTDLC